MEVKEIIVSRKDIISFLYNNIYYSLILERIEEEWYTVLSDCDNETLWLVWEIYWYIEDTENEVLIINY